MNDRTKDEQLFHSLSEELAQCREREWQFEMAFHASPDGLVLYELQGVSPGRFTQTNATACRLLGYTPDELKLRTVEEVTAPEDRRHLDDALRSLRTTDSLVHEQTLLRKDGTRVRTELHSRLFRRRDRAVVVSAIRHFRARPGAGQWPPLYGRILDSMVEGVWVADADDVIFYANRGMAEIAGVPADKLVGNNVTRDFPESTLAHFLPRYLDAKTGREPIRYEAVPVYTPAGRPSFQSGWLVPLWEGEHLQGIICTVEDVTQRKRAEEAWLAGNERLRLITDALPVLISYVDAEERYRFANAAYETWFGIPRSQLYGRTVAELFGEAAYGVVRNHLRRALAGEEVRYAAHVPYRFGRAREVEALLIPHRGTGDKVLGVYALTQDVTELIEHKRAEEALRASEARYRRQAEELQVIYQSVPVGLAVLDRQLRFVRVNGHLADINGVPEAEHLGRRVHEVVPALADQVEALARRVFDTGEPALGLEVQGETPARPGVERLWREQWLPLKDEAGRVWGIHIVVEEITEQRRAEKAMKERMKELRAFYHLSDMAERRDFALPKFYQELVSVLPESWQYPEVTCARIVIDGQEFRSGTFAESQWKQVAPIRVLGADAGRIEVGYLEQKPAEDEGPFLKEERQLLEAIAERVGHITERERAEAAMRRASAYTRSLIEASLDPLVTISTEGKITDVNEATVRATGVPRHQLLGSDFSNYFTDPEKARAGYRAVFVKGFVTDYALALRHVSGKVIDVLYNASVYRSETGEIAGVFAAARDITERKRAMESLERSERLLRIVLDAMPVGVFLTDASGRILETNPAIGRIWGTTPHVGMERYHEYKGWWPATGSRVAPDEWASVRATKEGEAILNEIIDIESFDGIRRTILNSAVPLRDVRGEVTGAVVVNQDITELRRAERALREANARLEQALADLRATREQAIQAEKLAAIGTLAAGIAHELNNPLMGVMGYVVRSLHREQDPEVREMLANAVSALERMRDLIKNLLGFARPLFEGPLTDVSIGTALRQTLALMKPDLDAHGIRVSVEIPSDLPQVMARPNELQQVFLNLLLNARDAMEESIPKEIHISARKNERQVVLSVADTGKGIPLEIRGRIFDPFFTTKPPGKGTGLGLAIARNIVADLGGTLMAESPEGKGAIFQVVLPVPPGRTGRAR